jgi:hypothetical protein
MIVGHDLMSQLRIILDFDGQTMMWDESTIKMKEYEDLFDIKSPINEFYWHGGFQYATTLDLNMGYYHIA